MTPETNSLLRAHQQIIDAWFQAWHRRNKARIDDVFAKKAEPDTRPARHIFHNMEDWY